MKCARQDNAAAVFSGFASLIDQQQPHPQIPLRGLAQIVQQALLGKTGVQRQYLRGATLFA
jgi:hypothetical protein